MKPKPLSDAEACRAICEAKSYADTHRCPYRGHGRSCLCGRHWQMAARRPVALVDGRAFLRKLVGRTARATGQAQAAGARTPTPAASGSQPEKT